MTLLENPMAMGAGGAKEDKGKDPAVSAILRNEIEPVAIVLRNGYPITPEDREKCCGLIREVLDNPDANRRQKARAMMLQRDFDKHNQRDLFQQENRAARFGLLQLKYQRIDSGQPTESVQVQSAPVQVLEMPAWMRELAEPKKFVESRVLP